MSEWICVCCRFCHSSKKELLMHLEIIASDIRDVIYNNELGLEEIKNQIKILNGEAKK